MARKNYESEFEQLAEPVPPEAPKKAAPAVPSDPVATPRAWAEKLGHVIKGDARLPQSQTIPSMAHAVADKLHGWSQHEHHYQASPLLLTQAAYEAALDCACNQKTKVAVPHDAALSPASSIAKARAKAAAEKQGSR